MTPVKPLLEVNDLKVYFHTRNGVVKAVDGISYSINPGETLGIVGESGSGKSVSCYSLLNLIPSPPGKLESGTALFSANNSESIDLLSCSKKQLQKISGNTVSMIFQDPMTCLNPYLRVGNQLMESLLLHKKVSKKEAKLKAITALQEVGIQDAEKRVAQYPHEFSGGMRQRVMIAMALITEPDLLIADEPTTALDVTIQAQILELIKKLQKQRGMAVIFITHDLGVIAGIADHVMVMYAGQIVEQSSTEQIFNNPQHPYTKALMDSIPGTHDSGKTLYTISGLPPDLSKQIIGCAFAPRCEFSASKCFDTQVEIKEVDQNHLSSCLLVQEKKILQSAAISEDAQ